MALQRHHGARNEVGLVVTQLADAASRSGAAGIEIVQDIATPWNWWGLLGSIQPRSETSECRGGARYAFNPLCQSFQRCRD